MPVLKAFLQAKQQARDDHKYALALEKATEMGVPGHWVKRREHLSLGWVVGKGAWGTVYRCRYEQQQYWDGNKSYVAKLISPTGMRPEEATQLQNEILLWSTLEHPHCVRFRGVIFDVKGGDCFLLCDYMSGGSLLNRQKAQRESNAPPPRTEVLVAELLQIAGGALHLHERGIVHRDLKSDNVLIATDGRLCLSDFGLARLVCPRGDMTSETGSYRWMAPEVTLHKQYGLPCDVYSFAMICTEMVTRTVPFAGTEPVSAAGKAAMERWRPKLPEDVPAAIVALCRACWRQEPADRLTFEQIRESLASYAAPAEPLEAPVARTAAEAHAPASLASYMGADADEGSVRLVARPPFIEHLSGQKGVEGCEDLTVSVSVKSRPRGVSPQSTITLFAEGDDRNTDNHASRETRSQSRPRPNRSSDV
jgi:serine/threonine protein kinase